LLYKCKINKKKDVLDLLNTLPSLSKEKTIWLKKAIAMTHKNHPWINLIK